LSGSFDLPEYWLKLAQDSRAEAEQISDPYSKRTLLLIAQRYAMMAVRAKQKTEEKAAQKRA
jgi:hypothetical protein